MPSKEELEGLLIEAPESTLEDRLVLYGTYLQIGGRRIKRYDRQLLDEVIETAQANVAGGTES